MNTIKYPFTKAGIEFFVKNMYDSIFAVMYDPNGDIQENFIHIRIGVHEITLYDTPMHYEYLEEYLKYCLEEENA